MVGPVAALEGRTPEDKHVTLAPEVPSSEDCISACACSRCGEWEGLVGRERETLLLNVLQSICSSLTNL